VLRSSENLTKNDYKKENDEGNFYFNYLSPFVVDFILGNFYFNYLSPFVVDFIYFLFLS